MGKSIFLCSIAIVLAIYFVSTAIRDYNHKKVVSPQNKDTVIVIGDSVHSNGYVNLGYHNNVDSQALADEEAGYYVPIRESLRPSSAFDTALASINESVSKQSKLLSKVTDDYLDLHKQYLEAIDREKEMYRIIRELDVTGTYNDTCCFRIEGKDTLGYGFQFDPFKFSKNK